MPRVALLCSGLGNVHRGHEVFARDLFTLLKDDLDITLFKGGGPSSDREVVVPHVQRGSSSLDAMHLAVAPKWHSAAEEVARMRVEGETFAWGSLEALLAGNYDVLHCLEQEVCEVLWSQRHLFRRTPKILWSNGGALPASDIPHCDFVQEHTEYNLKRSDSRKAFMIPHGVDLARFHPKVSSDFRARHGIPLEAFVVISVGTICYWHKRMDHVIREVASVPGAWLLIVGQESPDSAEIKSLGRQLMGDRIIFMTMAHDELPKAYAAANVFTLGSLFETFGIVYIEAMAMGLPVICTDHPNQRGIVKEGVFIDMRRKGELRRALTETPLTRWTQLRERGIEIAHNEYDLLSLKKAYIDRYQSISGASSSLPKYSLAAKLTSNSRNAWRRGRRLLGQIRGHG